MENNNASTVAWVSLITAVLALILAWTAFNRAGADLEAMVAAQIEEAAEEAAVVADDAADATLEATADTLEVSADAMDAGAEASDAAAVDVREAQ
ncbi:MAG: hypothetical protein V4668_02140 [Patescibacteria group bacterium]